MPARLYTIRYKGVEDVVLALYRLRRPWLRKRRLEGLTILEENHLSIIETQINFWDLLTDDHTHYDQIASRLDEIAKNLTAKLAASELIELTDKVRKDTGIDLSISINERFLAALEAIGAEQCVCPVDNDGYHAECAACNPRDVALAALQPEKDLDVATN